ncbi:hypothetical protein CHARACLAT_007298 [Characodon lateralis]|uniref:Uncharacterized protein n=1 Tax=Characodon lateralis TaxID=208331 RepID=A0ABU7DYG9_9TELE|nr:hypothetical protein [Characodon lateralis]
MNQEALYFLHAYIIDPSPPFLTQNTDVPQRVLICQHRLQVWRLNLQYNIQIVKGSGSRISRLCVTIRFASSRLIYRRKVIVRRSTLHKLPDNKKKPTSCCPHVV